MLSKVPANERSCYIYIHDSHSHWLRPFLAWFGAKTEMDPYLIRTAIHTEEITNALTHRDPMEHIHYQLNRSSLVYVMTWHLFFCQTTTRTNADLLNWTLEHKFQWHLNQNTKILKIWYLNVVCNIAAILFKLGWVNYSMGNANTDQPLFYLRLSKFSANERRHDITSSLIGGYIAQPR